MKTKKTGHKLEKLEAEGSNYNDSVYLSCVFDGDRYHIWVTAPDFKPDDNTLYKNPLLGIKYGAPGYYRTKQLEQDRGLGKVIVPVLLEAAPRLYKEWEARNQKEIERIKEANREKERKQKIRDSAPALLEVAKTARLVAGLFGTDDPIGREELREAVRLLRKQAGTAIRKAEEGR